MKRKLKNKSPAHTKGNNEVVPSPLSEDTNIQQKVVTKIKNDDLSLCPSCYCAIKTVVGTGKDKRDNGKIGIKRCGKCGEQKS